MYGSGVSHILIQTVGDFQTSWITGRSSTGSGRVAGHTHLLVGVGVGFFRTFLLVPDRPDQTQLLKHGVLCCGTGTRTVVGLRTGPERVVCRFSSRKHTNTHTHVCWRKREVREDCFRFVKIFLPEKRRFWLAYFDVHAQTLTNHQD